MSMIEIEPPPFKAGSVRMKISKTPGFRTEMQPLKIEKAPCFNTEMTISMMRKV